MKKVDFFPDGVPEAIFECFLIENGTKNGPQLGHKSKQGVEETNFSTCAESSTPVSQNKGSGMQKNTEFLQKSLENR